MFWTAYSSENVLYNLTWNDSRSLLLYDYIITVVIMWAIYQAKLYQQNTEYTFEETS